MRAEANKKKRDIQAVTTNEDDEEQEPEKKVKSEKGGQIGSAFGRKAGKG